MRKTLIATALLVMLTGTATGAGRARNDYSKDEQSSIMQGVAGIGILAHCEINEYYTSEIGPVAFDKMQFIFKTIGKPELVMYASRLFTGARENGVYPMIVRDSEGKASIEPLPVTDEAGCKMVEETIKVLMAPGGLFDVSTVPEQQGSLQ